MMRMDCKNLRLSAIDKVGYYNDGYVKWLGGFTQLSYDGKISSFINLSAANSPINELIISKERSC